MSLPRCVVGRSMVLYFGSKKKRIGLNALKPSCLRNVFCRSSSRLSDRTQTTDLRSFFSIPSFDVILRQGRLRWFGHIKRMDDEQWQNGEIEQAHKFAALSEVESSILPHF